MKVRQILPLLLVLLVASLLQPLGIVTAAPDAPETPRSLSVVNRVQGAPLASNEPVIPTTWSVVETITPVSAPDGITMVEFRGILNVVWGNSSRLYHTYQFTTGSWSTPRLIAYGRNPSAIVVGDTIQLNFDNIFVNNREIYHIFFDGIRWELPNNVSRTTGESQMVALTYSDNQLFATWQDHTPGYNTTYIGNKKVGDWIWSNRPIPSGRGDMPKISPIPRHVLVDCWTDEMFDTHVREVLCSELGYDAIWEPPALVSDSPISATLEIDVVLANPNMVLVTWVENGIVKYSWGYGDVRWTYVDILGQGEKPVAVSNGQIGTIGWQYGYDNLRFRQWSDKRGDQPIACP